MAIPMSAALMAERHEHCPGGQDAVGRLVPAGEGHERQPRQNRAIHPYKGEESPTRRRQD